MYTPSPEKRGPYNSYRTHAALPQTTRPQPQVFADDFMTNLNELTKCKEDIFYFFSTYLKIYETRPAYGIGYKPFVLWPRQREYVQALEEALQGKHGLVVEKCRDMGATLVALGWITWHWLFDPDFQALLGSLREDEVKLGSSHDSLFSKLRDFVENLPALAATLAIVPNSAEADALLLTAITAGQKNPEEGKARLLELRRRWNDPLWRRKWGRPDFFGGHPPIIIQPVEKP